MRACRRFSLALFIFAPGLPAQQRQTQVLIVARRSTPP